MNHSVRAQGLLVGLALFASACAVAPDDADGIDEAQAISSSMAMSTALDAPAIESLSSADPAKAAASVASAGGGESCRTRTVDPLLPNVVHVVLDHCTGRLGRHDISGNMTITFTENGDGSLHAEHQSSDLTVDGLPATHQVSADITIDGSMRHVTAHGVWTREREDGETMTRTVDHSIDIDRSTHCRVINGAAVSQRPGKGETDSIITDFAICAREDGEDACPTGTIEHTRVAKGKHVVEHFDGTTVETIDVSTHKGTQTRERTLDCTPAGAI